mgnify:CR=1 FL=1
MRALWISALLLAAGPALAQLVTLEPGAAQRCLTPAPELRGTPEYPFGPWKRGEAGSVEVELSFVGPDKRPSVSVLGSKGGDEFVDAVKEHVDKFRVPCLTPTEGPSAVRFEFVFKPESRKVHFLPPTDPGRTAKAIQIQCVRHAGGEAMAAYPREARVHEIQGRVLAQLTFTAADQPPTAKVFARRAARVLKSAVENWVEGLRMPCHSGGPVEATWLYVFTLDDHVYGFKPLTLIQFLGAVRGIQEQTLNFDFNGMNCPFDVSLRYRKPFLPNTVGEFGSTHQARRPFLDWLSQVELDLPGPVADSVFGDQVTLTIPCTKINLNPKEKS